MRLDTLEKHSLVCKGSFAVVISVADYCAYPSPHWLSQVEEQTGVLL